jgi:hypothetical protein
MERLRNELAAATGREPTSAELAVALGVKEEDTRSLRVVGRHPVSLNDPIGGDGEHDDEAPNAVDRNSATYWTTEHYRGGLNKDGVGVVFDARAPKTVSQLRVSTDTPGYTAVIQAGDSPTGPFDDVSQPKTVNGTTTFALTNAHTRYYVVWITDLGSLSAAHVNEVRARG